MPAPVGVVGQNSKALDSPWQSPPPRGNQPQTVSVPSPTLRFGVIGGGCILSSTLGSGLTARRWRNHPGDGPDEADHRAGDRRGGNHLWLSRRHQMPIAPAHPLLPLPGDVAHGFRQHLDPVLALLHKFGEGFILLVQRGSRASGADPRPPPARPGTGRPIPKRSSAAAR